MFSQIFLNHHLGKKLDREDLGRKLANNEDITTLINNLITESDNYITNNASDDEAAATDNHALHHAALHLEHAELELNQKQATIDALGE